jgi:transcriptional regulator with XRE-family HTH domain
MTIREKLARLTELANKGAVSRRAGLDRSTLWRILQGKSTPRVEALVALAKVLGVDPGWLVDPSRGWPPVRTEGSKAEPQVA